MVASNPLFQGKWTLRRLNSMVLSDIWPEILFFSAVAIAVVFVTKKTEHDLSIGNQLLTVGGVVLGLVISFRTSSAYEKYQDGSKMWTNITTGSRNLAQLIWIHVLDERTLNDQPTEPILNVIIEKKTMINMVHAFAVSVKHLLRNEPGVYYEDLYPSVAFLPKHATPTRRESDILPIWHIQGGRILTPSVLRRKNTVLSLVNLTHPPLKPASLPPKSSIYNYIPVLRLPRWGFKKAHQKFALLSSTEDDLDDIVPKKRKSEVAESAVPLEIFLVLSNYSAFLMKNGLIPLPVATTMTNTLLALHDSLSQLDRICNTPLPFAYQAHLRTTVWLYLLFLPFQMVEILGYYAIPATSLFTFLLVGFLELGQQIENPFNYDLNDLDLERFCDTIRRELHEITTSSNIEPSAFLFCSKNQPFAPCDRRSAKEMVENATGDGEYTSPPEKVPLRGMDGLRVTMVKNWAEVQQLTRRAE